MGCVPKPAWSLVSPAHPARPLVPVYAVYDLSDAGTPHAGRFGKLASLLWSFLYGDLLKHFRPHFPRHIITYNDKRLNFSERIMIVIQS